MPAWQAAVHLRREMHLIVPPLPGLPHVPDQTVTRIFTGQVSALEAADIMCTSTFFISTSCGVNLVTVEVQFPICRCPQRTVSDLPMGNGIFPDPC